MALLHEILAGCWNTLRQMAPFLLLGFLLAGLLSVLLPTRWVKRHLAKPGKSSVIKSALLGVPMPLCSCGVLPVATWMRRHGASKGATGAFLLSTPQSGMDGFLVALSLLGLGMALYIPVATFLTGLLLGLMLNLFPDPSRELERDAGDGHAKEGFLRRIFHHGFVTSAGDIAVPLAVGILFSGLLGAFVDAHQFADVGQGFLAKLTVVLVATPLYVCATASLPIGASMLMAGLSPGTVFVFLLAGPATNAATFTTIAKLLGKWEAVTYLVSTILFALALGTLLDHLPFVMELGAPPAHVHEHLTLWHSAAAIALLILLPVAKHLRGHHS